MLIDTHCHLDAAEFDPDRPARPQVGLGLVVEDQFAIGQGPGDAHPLAQAAGQRVRRAFCLSRSGAVSACGPGPAWRAGRGAGP